MTPGLRRDSVRTYHRPPERQAEFMFTGSLVALVTPMTPTGELDLSALQRLIDWHIKAGTDGLVVTGTTGESATLTKPEHTGVLAAAVEHAAGRIPVIAGTGSNSTAQTIELSREVDQLGVDGFLVVTPYYNKPTQEGLVRHFTAVADAVSRPLMLYNVPGRTAVDLQPATVARLAAHPNIFGIKEATGEVERVAELRRLCGPEFALYSGDDATGAEFMLAGGQGVVSVTANVVPEQMAALCAAALGGDAAKAAELDAPLRSLHRDLFIESNPTPVKWALAQMGLIQGGIRLPLLPLTAVHEATVRLALDEAGVAV